MKKLISLILAFTILCGLAVFPVRNASAEAEPADGGAIYGEIPDDGVDGGAIYVDIPDDGVDGGEIYIDIPDDGDNGGAIYVDIPDDGADGEEGGASVLASIFNEMPWWPTIAGATVLVMGAIIAIAVIGLKKEKGTRK